MARLIVHDTKFFMAVTRSPDMLVPWYLMASYGYYHLDESLLSDAVFDGMCKRLDAEWDTLTHWHRDVIRRDELTAGSCFLQPEDFPLRTRAAALILISELRPSPRSQ